MARINDFQPGNVITRVERSKGNNDGSYIGEPLFYMGIANRNIISLQLTGHFKGKAVELHLDWWDEGWDNYVHPMSLMTPDLLAQAVEKLQEYNKVQ